MKEMKLLHIQMKGIFSYRQMTLHLNRKFNEPLNHKRIYRLMKVAQLRSVIRVKKKRYKRSIPQYVTENILNRELISRMKNGSRMSQNLNMVPPKKLI